MKFNSKKTFQATVMTLIAMTAPAFTDETSSACCEQTPCQTCAPMIECPCFSECKQTEFTISGDLLFWESRLSGLEGAFGTTWIDERDDGHGKIVKTFEEHDKKPNFDWRAGFRIGADYLWDCFSLEAEWTHILGKAGKSNEGGSGIWRSKYNSVDLILGYKFYPCCNFFLKPYVGARGAKIEQTLHSNLTTTLYTEDKGLTYPTINIDNKEDFTGVGPLVGLSANWDIGCNFSIYGDVNVTGYYGNIKGEYDHVDSFDDSDYVSYWDRDRTFNCVEMGGSLGVRWDLYTCYPCALVHFMLKLGVEQRRICDFSEISSSGSLALSGGVFEAGVGIRF